MLPLRNTVRNHQGLFMALMFLVALAGCKNPEPMGPSVDFDREALLEHLGTALIVPAYQELSTAQQELVTAVDNFSQATTSENLAAVKASYLTAYEKWQAAAPFNFGPAADANLLNFVNIFPTDVQQIENNVTTANYDLEAAVNLDAQGFPALDYLLFHEAESETLTAFEEANRMAYLQALTARLNALFSEVAEAWDPAAGNYAATFANNTGSDVGSSLGLFVNELNRDFEVLKNARLGIPLGYRTLGVPRPELVEAYYSNHSTPLAQAHFAAIRRAYYGLTLDGTNGLGLDDYLDALDAAYLDGKLVEALDDQIAATEAALALLPDNLSEAVQNEGTAAPVDQAYQETQALVILLKADMPSALGVLITYQDNDGD